MLRSAVIILSVGMTMPAAAKPVRECQIRILRPVTDDMGHRWSAGRLLPVTIIRRDANGTSFCAHSGSCVPRMTRNGQAAQLVNCRPGAALGNGDFRLDPNPTAKSSADADKMRTRFVIENKLSTLGFSNAASGTWANDYAANPASAHGRLVARALAGSAEALAMMKAKLP